MKILQVNSVYRYGSTGKIMADLHTGFLERGHESVVCYGRRRKPDEPHVYKVSSELEGKIHSVQSRLFGVEFAHSPVATSRLIARIKHEKPDVVHLHCLNGHFVNVYRLLTFLKKAGIPTVLTLHAEIMHTAGCDHAMDCEKWKTECHDCPRIRGKISHFFRDDARACYRKMRKAMEGFKDFTVVGVSEWLTERAKQSPIFQGCRFETVHNGIDTSVFTKHSADELRRKLGIPEDKKIILHVTPSFYHPIKGGHYVLELAEKMPDAQFLIVGFNGDPSPLPPNVIAIAHTQDQHELAEYYSMADCLICTSLRESFPTVCLEAVSCGCNVVGFHTGGVPDTIPEGMGTTVPCYDVDAFRQAVDNWSTVRVSETRMREVNEANSRERMVERYFQVYTSKV